MGDYEYETEQAALVDWYVLMKDELDMVFRDANRKLRCVSAIHDETAHQPDHTPFRPLITNLIAYLQEHDIVKNDILSFIVVNQEANRQIECSMTVNVHITPIRDYSPIDPNDPRIPGVCKFCGGLFAPEDMCVAFDKDRVTEIALCDTCSVAHSNSNFADELHKINEKKENSG